MGKVLSFLGNFGGGKGTYILAGVAFLAFGFGLVTAPEGVDLAGSDSKTIGEMFLAAALIRLRAGIARKP